MGTDQQTVRGEQEMIRSEIETAALVRTDVMKGMYLVVTMEKHNMCCFFTCLELNFLALVSDFREAA